MGVSWLRTIRTYNVGTMLKTLREAMSTDDKGLKVIVADGLAGRQGAVAEHQERPPRVLAQIGRRHVEVAPHVVRQDRKSVV